MGKAGPDTRLSGSYSLPYQGGNSTFLGEIILEIINKKENKNTKKHKN